MPGKSKPPKPKPPMPHNRVSSAQGVQTVTQELEVHSGPIPSPHTLEHYDNIEPGAANRIITMAENQAAHRQFIEKKAISSNVRDSLLGVIFAFIIGMTITICGTTGRLLFIQHSS